MADEKFPSEELLTKRLVLRKVFVTNASSLLDYYLSNRDDFKPWEPLRSDEFYSLNVMHERLHDMQATMDSGNALHLLLFDRSSEEMLGECNFTNIIRGPFQACHLRFSVDIKSQDKGLMYEALSVAIGFVFQT